MIENKQYKNITLISIALRIILLALSYLLIDEFFSGPDDIFFWRVMFLLGMLFTTNFMKPLISYLSENISSIYHKRRLLKNKFLILMFWILSVLSVLSSKNSGLIIDNVSPSIIIFASFLPIVWLFKLTGASISKVSFILILFAGILANPYRQTADIFAQLTYLWLGTSVIIKLTKENKYV